MRVPKAALTSLLLFATLGAPQLALSPSKGLDSEMWVYAQSPQSAPPTTTLHVYSLETIVDVTVTDSKGNPVHGLTQSDFTVKEDNKPQPIRSFEEFSSKPAAALPNLPPNTYTNLQPPAPSGATNILWLDFTNAAPLDQSINLPIALGRQRRAKVGAMDFLKQMPVGTRAAVLGAWYPPGHLSVLQGVTSDRELLSAAVDTMPFDTDGSAVSGEALCAQQDRRRRMTLESLSQIASTLAQIKGRKNLLWYTMRIRSLVDQHPAPCLTNLFSQVQRAYGLLAAAQVTVYPISVRGVEENSIDKAEDNLGLETVAEATGGKAYYNSNDLADLTAKAVDSGSDYYTLSYIPPGSKYDGRHHTIELEVDKPGLHLTYRDEYYAEDPSKMRPTPGLTLATSLSDIAPANSHPDLAAEMRTAMGRAMPTSTQLIFNVYVEPAPAGPPDASPTILGTLDPKLKGKPLTRYSFLYNFPASRLAFSSGPNGTHNGSLEIDLAAYDPDGKLVTGLSQTVTMPLSDSKYQQFIQGPFHFLQQLDLPPGQLFLRIGILDRTSNKIGTLEIPLTVPRK